MNNIKENVYLNIYDLSNFNNCLYDIGLGIYHTSIKIYDYEYNFGSIQGIYKLNKKCLLPLREKILMGYTFKTQAEIELLIKDLEYDFNSNRYHPTNNNCNHFTSAILDILLNKKMPSYVNRLPKFCTCIGCLLPKALDNDYKNDIICTRYDNLDNDIESNLVNMS